jgi:hypothetical protein
MFIKRQIVIYIRVELNQTFQNITYRIQILYALVSCAISICHIFNKPYVVDKQLTEIKSIMY